METFYHGTSVLFKNFDISHALEGDGKAKFGFGTYVTESYTSAAHYAYNKKRPENKDYYVYTLEIPDLTEDNHLFSVRSVHPSIIERTEKALGVRQGKGKGNVEYWVAVIQPGKILYEMGGVGEAEARHAFELAAAKLSVKTTFVTRTIL